MSHPAFDKLMGFTDKLDGGGTDLKESIKRILREDNKTKIMHQEEHIKIDLQSMVKDIGWELTSKAVGGPKRLVKLAFNNDPIEFLNLFNDLDVVVDSNETYNEFYWTFYRYEKKNNLIVYDNKNREAHISYENIWSFLEKGFDLKYKTIKELTHTWLYKEYNLRFFQTLYLETSYHHFTTMSET
jgi:hypothetical protein